MAFIQLYSVYFIFCVFSCILHLYAPLSVFCHCICTLKFVFPSFQSKCLYSHGSSLSLISARACFYNLLSPRTVAHDPDGLLAPLQIISCPQSRKGVWLTAQRHDFPMSAVCIVGTMMSHHPMYRLLQDLDLDRPRSSIMLLVLVPDLIFPHSKHLISTISVKMTKVTHLPRARALCNYDSTAQHLNTVRSKATDPLLTDPQLTSFSSAPDMHFFFTKSSETGHDCNLCM